MTCVFGMNKTVSLTPYTLKREVKGEKRSEKGEKERKEKNIIENAKTVSDEMKATSIRIHFQDC